MIKIGPLLFSGREPGKEKDEDCSVLPAPLGGIPPHLMGSFGERKPCVLGCSHMESSFCWAELAV